MADFLITSDVWGSNGREFLVKQGTSIKLLPCDKQNLSDLSSKTLVFTDAVKFKNFCKLYHVDATEFPPKAFQRAYKSLGLPEGVQIPWGLCLTQKRYYEFLIKYANDLSNQMDKFGNKGLTYWQEVGSRLYSFINETPFGKGMTIDREKWQAHLSGATDSQLGFLQSFAPMAFRGVTTDLCKYTTTGTKTGRLTVVSGPNILHLKKEYRDILKSRFEGGQIWYLDYSSLEPRVLLASKGSSPVPLIGNLPQDIYTKALFDLGLEGKVPRNIAKTAILSAIYGQSEENTVKQLEGFVEQPLDFVRSLNDYFGIDALKQRLSEELSQNNGEYISNLYGRPVFCDDTKPYALLNYYVQSTAVDVALLGFEAIVNRLMKSGLCANIVPILILHDALLLDIDKDYLEAIPKLVKLGSTGIIKFKHLDFFLSANPLVAT